MATIVDAARLADVVNEVQQVESELHQRRLTLTALLWRGLPPAVVENRIRATDQRTQLLESRLRVLLKEQEALIVRVSRQA